MILEYALCTSAVCTEFALRIIPKYIAWTGLWYMDLDLESN